MVARRLGTVCLSCRHHASITTRRRIQHSVKRRSQAAVLSHQESHETFEAVHGRQEQGHTDGMGSAKAIADAIKHWKTHIPLDDIREAMQAIEVLGTQRAGRIEKLRNLSNPFPAQPQSQHNGHHTAKTNLILPEAQAAPIPYATYRELLRSSTSIKQTRAAIRAQLLQVQNPRDLLRVAAVAMQNQKSAEQLAVLHEPVMRALYRCRNTVTDAEVLRACSAIVSRLRFAGLVPHYQLLSLGLKFAARARSVNGMEKFLRLVHERSRTMTSNLFRSVIAKFSIGHRGLGEIRNGRWRRADLLQVLTGFDNCKHLPAEQQYHLGAFLDRSDWQYLHGWVAVLARCRDSDAVWDEWLLWKQNPARTNPKKLEGTERYLTSAWRGDYWFVEQMTYTGDIRRAWRILEDSQIPFSSLKDRIKTRLLDGAEHASIWTPEMSDAMLDKYDAALSEIERAFGVVWQVAEAADGEGQHVLFRDQEEALDELGADDWKLEIDYGFPIDDNAADAILSTKERSIYGGENRRTFPPPPRAHQWVHENFDTHDLRRNA